jgi:HAD superfamily hydrolase (TIGR01490 family)
MHEVKEEVNQPKYAFFDVDETVISMKSMFSFMKIYFSYNKNTLLEKRFNYEMASLIKSDTDRRILNARYYSFFKYFSISSVNTACKIWFDKYSSKKEIFYNKNVIARLKLHQHNNIECVFVSGSFKELIQLIADDLNIKNTLCINLEKKDHMYTGNIIPPQTIGYGKADAIKLFLSKNNATNNQCFAYGDDISDVDMLETVTFPCVISGEKQLEKHAISAGWEIISPK